MYLLPEAIHNIAIDGAPDAIRPPFRLHGKGGGVRFSMEAATAACSPRNGILQPLSLPDSVNSRP
jgi:hypothetical protein